MPKNRDGTTPEIERLHFFLVVLFEGSWWYWSESRVKWDTQWELGTQYPTEEKATLAAFQAACFDGGTAMGKVKVMEKVPGEWLQEA